ncbi:unnamed protein product [Soboliphyme baturini]|uniref:Transporter n=1 Tax=Soboliphyme baturini TaxID=241478 RepID=A0A183J3L4_9BILA|nr:unnamed protein product [Soboliphyme baturini]
MSHRNKFEDVELIKSDSCRFEQVVRLEEKRGSWASKVDYILSMIGYSVGLSNIWRFPYLCYQNGGGAFLIPYIICLFLCGVPLFFMEVSIGQFTSRSAATMWSICPLFKGVGWATVVITLIVSTYFNVLLAYGISFLFQSLTTGPLPWSHCGNPWNTDKCLDYNNKTVYDLFLQYKQWTSNGSAGVMNPDYETFVNVTYSSPSEEFF